LRKLPCQGLIWCVSIMAFLSESILTLVCVCVVLCKYSLLWRQIMLAYISCVAHIRTHTHAHIRMHARTHTPTHSRTHTLIRTHTYMHTNNQTHIPTPVIHRAVAKWVKSWDPCVFGTTSSNNNSNSSSNNKQQPQQQASLLRGPHPKGGKSFPGSKGSKASDGRPEFKAILLAGPPGAGEGCMKCVTAEHHCFCMSGLVSRIAPHTSIWLDL